MFTLSSEVPEVLLISTQTKESFPPDLHSRTPVPFGEGGRFKTVFPIRSCNVRSPVSVFSLHLFLNLGREEKVRRKKQEGFRSEVKGFRLRSFGGGGVLYNLFFFSVRYSIRVVTHTCTSTRSSHTTKKLEQSVRRSTYI